MMPVEPGENPKKMLGALLIEAGLIQEEQLNVALEEQRRHGGRIGYNLVRLGFLSPFHLAAFLQDHFGLGLLQENLSERQKAADAIPRYLALYYKIAPLKLQDQTLTVAISQIDHPNLIELLSEVTGYKVDPLIYPETEIRRLIDTCYGLPTDHGVELSANSDNVFTIVDGLRKIKALAQSQLKNERDAGEWLRSIVAEAIREKSREIMIRPEARQASVSFKKDTFYLADFSLTSELHDDLTFLLFRLSKMNALQQQKPQYGRFQVKIHDRKIVMIVSAFPTIYGVRFLLEMFDEKLLKHSFDEITKGYPQLRKSLETLFVPGRKGLCLIAGPENSGKTSLLYSLLSRFKTVFRNVMTLEQAVRYPVTGVTQTQVGEEQVDAALEEVIKQKPDLLAVDSIRKPSSAERLFLAAARMPVIATFPCFDTYVALDWLCTHNLKSAVKAGLLYMLVSPRLIPHLCLKCAIPCELTPDQMLEFDVQPGTQLKMNQGCESCRNRPDHSAELIFEYQIVDDELLSWLDDDHSAAALRERARKAGRQVLFDVVLQNSWSDALDMLSILKLRSVI